MILFLDFDGVLHPYPCMTRQYFCQLPLMERILRGFPGVEIVISSAWRLRFSDQNEALLQMRKHFSSDIAERVVGTTPDHRDRPRSEAPPGLGEFLREWECLSWLRENRPAGTAWLALDDQPGLFTPDCTDLMLTSFKTGFRVGNGWVFCEHLKQRGGGR